MLETLHNKAERILTPHEDVGGTLNQIFNTLCFGGETIRTTRMMVNKGEDDFLIYNAIFQYETGKLANTTWATAGTKLKHNLAQHIQSLANQMAVYIVGWFTSCDEKYRCLIPAGVIENLAPGL